MSDDSIDSQFGQQARSPSEQFARGPVAREPVSREPALANPYQPPDDLGVTPALSNWRSMNAIWLSVGWTIVVGMNMFLPLMIGLEVTQDGGRFGMIWAVSLCLVAGWMLCAFQPALAKSLIVGSFLLAFTQFFPVLQIMSGVIAFAIMNLLMFRQLNGSNDLTDPDAFLITIIVAVCLITQAAVLGWLIKLAYRYWNSSDEPTRDSSSFGMRVDDLRR